MVVEDAVAFYSLPPSFKDMHLHQNFIVVLIMFMEVMLTIVALPMFMM